LNDSFELRWSRPHQRLLHRIPYPSTPKRKEIKKKIRQKEKHGHAKKKTKNKEKQSTIKKKCEPTQKSKANLKILNSQLFSNLFSPTPPNDSIFFL
jgi:hypothetical protein